MSVYTAEAIAVLVMFLGVFGLGYVLMRWVLPGRFRAWFFKDVRRSAAVFAVMLAIVMGGSKLMAFTCIEAWEQAVMTADSVHSQCIVNATKAGFLAVDPLRTLCDVEQLSNVTEANFTYVSCMSLSKLLKLW